MQFFLTMLACAILLFIPGGDYLIPVAVGVSIFIGHLRNKRDKQSKHKP